MLPNFFLLGPPKTGTTALAEALSRHPDIFMSTPKEPNYFLYAGGNPYNLRTDRGVPDFQSYLGLFADAGAARIRGDASPYYIYAPHCAQEIRRQAPDARLMVILRNPVERAFSTYRYWYKDRPGFRSDPEDFREQFLSRALTTTSDAGRSGGLPMEWLQDMGRYADMLEPYDEHFTREQIMLLRYDDLSADPAGSMARTLEFLGVDVAAAPELRQVNVTFEPSWRAFNHWLNFDVNNPARRLLVASLRRSKLAASLREHLNVANRRPAPTRERPLPASIYNELIEVYADDVQRLAKRANLDLSDWLRPRVDEAHADQPLPARRRIVRAGSPQRPSMPATAPASGRRRFAGAGRSWSAGVARSAIRVAAPAALAAMAVAYWLWPADLIPDATKFGRIDDVACALASCALAVRMSVRGAAR